MKKNSLRWIGYFERKKSEEFVRIVCVNEIVSPRRRGRPIIRMEG